MTVARAEATVLEGRLITKTEAFGRLRRLGVPDGLIAEITTRRNGEHPAFPLGGRIVAVPLASLWSTS